MAKSKKMTERELAAHLEGEITSSLGYLDGKLTTQRSDALDRYYGKKYGNEQEGRSQIVTRDVADVIEWIMPSLMKIFTGGDKVVKFEPVGPEDVEMAKQSTDYVNHVIMRQNPGFSIIYQWFKDALLQKNGIVKHYWDDTSETLREEYKNLTEEEFTALLMDDSVEVKQHTENGGEEENVISLQPQQITHDVVVSRTYDDGQVRIEPVPPEEFLINKYAKTIEDARFVGHRVKRTKSELLEQGYPKSKVEKAFTNDEADYKAERLARFSHEQSSAPEGDIDEGIWITECYVRVDFDNDGIDELRKVTKVGDVLFDNEAVDSVPFSSLTPIPMPHKFYGLSI